MSRFEIREHVLPCQHVREYFHATASGKDEELVLHIKQYVPKDRKPDVNGRQGVTIIAAHCNGYVKEVYEALWDDLLVKLNQDGVALSGIWMADVSHQGTSGVLNEQKLGNEPHWFDHSRDLLHMINHFRKDITRPILGVGHSMGAAQLVHLANFHPRLFHSVVFLDPIISLNQFQSQPPLAKIATFRRDVWRNNSHAQRSVEKSKFYKTWDPRARESLIRHNFRVGPTKAIPDIDGEAVTMITTRHQEAFTLARPNYDEVGVDGEVGPEEKLTHPDVLDDDPSKAPFYRPEIRLAYLMLESLRPACLYVMGKRSLFSSEPGLEDKLKLIGSGVGGSGGLQIGKVKVEMVNGGHFFPFEHVAETAGVVGNWIRDEMARFEADEKAMTDLWQGKTGRERQMVDKRWTDNMSDWKGKTTRVKL